jgi:predicted nucleic acid-binding protein
MPFDSTRDGPEVAAITAILGRRHATDSAYIALARRLETTMWTFDGTLARNVAEVGLPVQLIGVH